MKADKKLAPLKNNHSLNSMQNPTRDFIVSAFLVDHTELFLLCANSLYQYYSKWKQVKIMQVDMRFKLQLENDSQAL